MNYLTFICVLLSAISIASSLDWVVMTDDSSADCVHVQWDVTRMRLLGYTTAGDGREVFIDPTSGQVDEASSLCNSTLSTMNVNFDKSVRLSLIFVSGSPVTMDGVLTFVPSEAFGSTDFDNTSQVIEIPGNIPLSEVGKSYSCVSPLELKFDGSTANNNYTLEVGANNTQIQAFGITNNTFSPATKCAADEPDDVTTQAATTQGPDNNSTTEAVTTQAPDNGTTEAPPTEAPTTVQPTTAPPSTDKYFYPNSTNPCIIVEGKFSLSVSYKKKDNSTSSVSVDVPNAESVRMEGKCPEDTNGTSTSEISMVWGAGNATRTLRFEFRATADTATISSVAINVDLDAATFPDAASETVTSEVSENIELSNPQGYYTCKSETPVTVEDSKVTMSEVKIQAFNVKGTDFSGEPQECAADLPSTTPAPVTPAPGNPPTNKYSVGRNCIVLDAGLQFVIPYEKSDNTTATATVGVPAKFTTSGTCGNITQTLTVEFYEDWKLQMTFNGGDSETMLADSTKFYLEEVKLDYKLQPDVFDSPKEPNSLHVANNTFDSSTFSADKTGSYKCTSKLEFTLDNGVSLDTYNLQVKAFATDNSTTFPSAGLAECPADENTNSVVPIAVGAALAGLVVIVLIAYLIGRRRSRGGYEQV